MKLLKKSLNLTALLKDIFILKMYVKINLFILMNIKMAFNILLSKLLTTALKIFK